MILDWNRDLRKVTMKSPVFYYFQTLLGEMEVESLLKETRKILKKCSRLTKQIYSDSSPHLLDTLHSEIVKGELLEHRLFQLGKASKKKKKN